MRVSNFLLWQIAYSELWVTAVLWPDFERDDLLEAVVDYQKRDAPVRRDDALMAIATSRSRPASSPVRSSARVLTAVVYGVVVLVAHLVRRRSRLGVVIGLIAAFAAAEFYAHRAPRAPAAQRGLRRRRGRSDAGRGGAVGDGGADRGRDRARRGVARCGTSLVPPRTDGRHGDHRLRRALHRASCSRYLVLIRQFDHAGVAGLVLTVTVLLSVWANDVVRVPRGLDAGPAQAGAADLAEEVVGGLHRRDGRLRSRSGSRAPRSCSGRPLTLPWALRDRRRGRRSP